MKKLLCIILLLFCLTANVSHSQSFKMFGQLPSGQFADGLVFYWRGIEAVEAVDESYYRNNGTITGATWVGNGLDFATTSDEVVLSNFAGAHATQTTIIIRVSPDSVVDEQYVLHHNDSIAVINKRVIILGFQDNYFNIFHSGYPTGNAADTQIPATAGAWQTIAYVCDGVRLQGYKDGILIFDVAADLNMTVPYGTVQIGNGAAGGDDYIGLMDLYTEYNRALSASEIAALYLNPNLPMQQDPIWLLQPSVVVDGIIPIIQAHARRRRAG